MSNRVAELRKRKGLSQTELGNCVGLTQRQVSYIEKGHVDLIVAIQLADFFECTLDELAGRTNVPGKSEADIILESMGEYERDMALHRLRADAEYLQNNKTH